ncbi:TfoX/Sxy family protein [Mesobacterium sp. TK19101]|uniref:TfoX/Sxy family protein n=1 Tax=Mesobacterium hydrothermale TaxID=3111907 RepID=A0ABU6HIL2_9RHOB|nr:TfoX/Sxy family protein [Mesobacterium sp. TK19101]MEC3862305.1 TfoX/Sxy family protein [Mesobacterium sp. TK19101]
MAADPTPVSTIRNLGPAIEAACARAGITSAEDLRALGAHEAYRKLLATGTRPHFIGYYVLHMALQGRPWNDCKGKEKDDLRRAFNQLKDELPRTGPPAGIERILDEIGLRPKPPGSSSG